MLASLFLMWGREAFHLTQLLTEPVYFVTRPELPGRLARLHRGAGPRDDPARGRPRRDAPARVRRVDVPGRDAAAGGRGTDPRGDDRGLPARSPLDAPDAGADGPPRGPAVGALAMTARRRRAGLDAPIGLAAPEWGGFDPRRPEGAARRPAGAPSGPRPPRLADGGQLDRPVPVLHLLGGQAPLGDTDPGRDAQTSSAAPPTRTARSWSSARRSGRSCWPASPGWPGPSRRPRALPDAQVRLRQPERLPGRAPRSRRRPARGRGGRGGHHPSSSVSCSSACRSTSRSSTGRSWWSS